MQLPPLKRIGDEDVPSEHRWAITLFRIVNSFFQNVYAILNGRIEFGSNIRSEIVILEQDAPFTNFRFPTKLSPVNGVLLLGIKGLSSAAVFTDTAVLRARQDGKSIVIDDLSGLVSGAKYQVRILVI